MIEVAISSEELDREKSFIYSAACVDEYWIVFPDQRVVEILTQPSEAGYARRETYQSGDSIACPRLSLPPLELKQLFH